MGRTCPRHGCRHLVHSRDRDVHPELSGQPRQLRRFSELRHSARRFSKRRRLDRDPQQHHHLAGHLHDPGADLRPHHGRAVRPGPVRDGRQVADIHAHGHLIGGVWCDLEVYVLVPACRSAPNRDVERGRDLLPSRPGRVAARSVAQRPSHPQQPSVDHRRDMGPHWILDGHPLRRAQGNSWRPA